MLKIEQSYAGVGKRPQKIERGRMNGNLYTAKISKTYILI
jgi:hypothetical protein